jgi:hypothetical protein
MTVTTFQHPPTSAYRECYALGWLLAFLALTGCDDEICTWEYAKEDIPKIEAAFQTCLKHASLARKGRDYTANDDEDYDLVVEQCGIQSRVPYQEIKVCWQPRRKP